MPLIDLKNCEVFFEDGYSETGAVNNGAGYSVGATSIAIDGITGIIPAGARISLDGVDMYQVVSTTETLGNTTAVVITPALRNALLDDDVVIVYGRFIMVKVGEGTLTWSEKKPREYKRDRGRLDAVRNADEEPMDVNFSLSYYELTASDPNTDPPTPRDVLHRIGAAADWESVNTADPCAPYCINIRLDHKPEGCDSFLWERVILPQYYFESLDHNPKEGQITTAGKCNALKADVTRFTQYPAAA